MTSPDNDLIAKPADDGKLLAGAGPFDTAEDLVRDVAQPFQEGKELNEASLGINTAVMAMDVAGAVADPLGTLASSVVGWIIENIGPVRQAFDDLLGDPPAVEAAANTWTNIGEQLDQTKQEHERSLSGLGGWSGPAAEAYKEQASGLITGLANASAAAGAVSNKIKIAGTLVTATRALVRDILAEMAGTLLAWGIPAAAAAIPTAGASIAAFTTRAVTKAVEVGTKIAGFLKKLFAALDKLSALAKSAGAAMRGKADELAQLARQMPNSRYGNQRAAELSHASGTHAARADSLDSAAGRLDSAANSGRDGIDRAADSANNWAQNANRRVGDWAQRVRENGPARRDAVKDFYGRVGQPPLNTRAADMDPTNSVQRAADRIDTVTGKGMLDGQNMVRAVASRDIAHLTPQVGDLIAPTKESLKAYNAMVWSEQHEKWDETDRNPNGGAVYPHR
jgi:hypothetical protein